MLGAWTKKKSSPGLPQHHDHQGHDSTTATPQLREVLSPKGHLHEHYEHHSSSQLHAVPSHPTNKNHMCPTPAAAKTFPCSSRETGRLQQTISAAKKTGRIFLAGLKAGQVKVLLRKGARGSAAVGLGAARGQGTRPCWDAACQPGTVSPPCPRCWGTRCLCGAKGSTRPAGTQPAPIPSCAELPEVHRKSQASLLHPPRRADASPGGDPALVSGTEGTKGAGNHLGLRREA